MAKKSPQRALRIFLDPKEDLRSGIESGLLKIAGICAENAKFPWAGGYDGVTDATACYTIEQATKYGPPWTLNPKRIAKRVARIPFGEPIPGGVKNLKPLKPYRFWQGRDAFVRNLTRTGNDIEKLLPDLLAIPEHRYWDDLGGVLRGYTTVHDALTQNLRKEGVGDTASLMIAGNLWYAVYQTLERFEERDENAAKAFLALVCIMRTTLVVGEKRDEPGTWVVYVQPETKGKDE